MSLRRESVASEHYSTVYRELFISVPTYRQSTRQLYLFSLFSSYQVCAMNMTPGTKPDTGGTNSECDMTCVLKSSGKEANMSSLEYGYGLVYNRYSFKELQTHDERTRARGHHQSDAHGGGVDHAQVLWASAVCSRKHRLKRALYKEWLSSPTARTVCQDSLPLLLDHRTRELQSRQECYR